MAYQFSWQIFYCYCCMSNKITAPKRFEGYKVALKWKMFIEIKNPRCLHWASSITAKRSISIAKASFHTHSMVQTQFQSVFIWNSLRMISIQLESKKRLKCCSALTQHSQKRGKKKRQLKKTKQQQRKRTGNTDVHSYFQFLPHSQRSIHPVLTGPFS